MGSFRRLDRVEAAEGGSHRATRLDCGSRFPVDSQSRGVIFELLDGVTQSRFVDVDRRSRR